MQIKKRRILLVDDNIRNLQVLGTLLRQEGYELSIAMNGEKALEMAVKTSPDLVLLDINMPVMDGFETCTMMKENPLLASIPVIFLTARVNPDDIIKGFLVGGVDYVGKPFHSKELLKRVETHLSIAEMRRMLEERAATIDRLAREQAAFVRHELHNGIAPLVWISDVLKKTPHMEEDERIQQIDRIHRGATQIQSLLTEIGKLQEIDRGRLSLTLESVNVKTLIKDEIGRLRSSVHPSLKFTVRIDTENAQIMADKTLLPGVFGNLIKNALEHVADLPPDKRGLSVAIGNERDGLKIAIANGGPAISQEALPLFFDKFNTTKKDRGGTGLGTSYAKIVVEAHGGTITVQSTKAEGTSVRIWLPRQPRTELTSVDPLTRSDTAELTMGSDRIYS